MSMRFLLLSLAMVGMVPALSAQDRLEETQERIRRMEQELRESRRRLSRLKKEKAALLAQVQTLEEQERLLEQILRDLTLQERLLDVRIARINREIVRLDSTLEAAVDRMIDGMVFLYKWPQPHPLALLLEARNLYDGFMALKAADAVMTYSERLYARAVEVQDSLEYFRRLREARRADLRAVRKRFEARRAELARTRKEKRSLHQKLSARERKELARIRELQKTIQELEALVQKILKEREEARRQARVVEGMGRPLAGRKLIWPVSSRRVVATFGVNYHPKYKTRTRNKGIDIDAGAGTVVQAVDRGEVVYSDEFLEYGGLVIVDHGSFYSLYAHLGERLVQKGDRVAQGDPVGKVDARGILHFELRVGGRAVNPLKYLP